jgi:hypothetical protein
MHFLAPDAPGQQIAIFVSGGEPIGGVDFFIQVGDGGAAVGGSDTGPTITGVDLITGAIFGANHTDVFVDSLPLIWAATTTTEFGTVPAEGRLATVTINTTGFFSGRYNLLLNPLATGPTQLVGAITTLANGWLQIGVPDAGDFDEDGDVDAADLTRWTIGFGTSGAATHTQGDADGDLDVDGADFLIWQRQHGSMSAMAASNVLRSAAPEPRGLLIDALVISAAMTSGRRREVL